MKIETYDATVALGLPVTLIDAVSVDREDAIELPRLKTLLATVAVARALEPAQLVGREIRFLRHVLDYTGAGFADAIGLSDKTAVSRWENDRSRPSGSNEKVIRQLVLNLLGPRAPGVEIGHNAIPGMRIRPNGEALPMAFALRRRRDAEGRRIPCYVPVAREAPGARDAAPAARGVPAAVEA